MPNVPGTSRDEYPFASTAEGGKGAWVGHIPIEQQWSQGGLLRNFFREHGVNPDDLFRVVVK